MTEQERFEAYIAKRTLMPANLTKISTGSTDYADRTIQMHWITWQAAHKKEGYVLVPVESVQEVLRWLTDDSGAFEYSSGHAFLECIKHRDILQQAVEAAQEAE